MEESRTRVPRGLPIAAVICLILGLATQPVVANMDPERLARNVIIAAVPFILVFVAILLVFMSVVWFAAARLNDRISVRAYRPIELVTIAGIILGVFFMFQPWLFALFKIGFFLLLFSTLSFIAWTHIRPRANDLEALDISATMEDV